MAEASASPARDVTIGSEVRERLTLLSQVDCHIPRNSIMYGGFVLARCWAPQHTSDGPNRFPQVFRVHAGGERRRPDEVREHHSQLAAFGVISPSRLGLHGQAP
jgi:hypothetical protein